MWFMFSILFVNINIKFISIFYENIYGSCVLASLRVIFTLILFDARVYFTLPVTTIEDDHDATLVQFFEELPKILEQAIRNIHSSNMTIPNILTMHTRRLKEQLHSY